MDEVIQIVKDIRMMLAIHSVVFAIVTICLFVKLNRKDGGSDG